MGSNPPNGVQRADRRIPIGLFECSCSKAIIQLQLIEGIDRSQLLPPGRIRTVKHVEKIESEDGRQGIACVFSDEDGPSHDDR